MSFEEERIPFASVELVRDSEQLILALQKTLNNLTSTGLDSEKQVHRR